MERRVDSSPPALVLNDDSFYFKYEKFQSIIVLGTKKTLTLLSEVRVIY